jgi:RimJ/RimL family protein N-acetyltransferase
MDCVRLTTERLALVPLTREHAEPLWAPMQDPATYEWISLTPPPSVDWLRDRWIRQEAYRSPDETEAWLAWAVQRTSDGRWVGKADATVARDVATNVGYFFFPPFWGQGYATEAVRAIVEHLDRQGVVEMRATVTVGNDRSGRVLERAGFVRGRILPENDVIRGVPHDDIEYVRTRR